jgi:hypothetical protein
MNYENELLTKNYFKQKHMELHIILKGFENRLIMKLGLIMIIAILILDFSIIHKH